MHVLYLDNHLLVVDKPAGMLTQGDRTGDRDLLNEAKAYLKTRFKKPGNVFVGLVHRLDRPVSGVIVLARTSKAAARLAAQFRDRTVEKKYLAIVEGRVVERLDLHHFLKKTKERTVVVRSGVSGSKEAVLTCRPMLVVGGWSLLEVTLTTGRPHQIRAQLAEMGHPILGDRRYGGRRWQRDAGIALHCWQIGVEHPTKRERMQWRVGPPKRWPSEVAEFLSSQSNYLAVE